MRNEKPIRKRVGFLCFMGRNDFVRLSEAIFLQVPTKDVGSTL